MNTLAKIGKLMFGTLIVAGLTVNAQTTYVWTGAQDSYWTNAANWTVGGSVASVPPGRCYDADGNLNDAQILAVVQFGAIQTENTTVDLDGFYEVTNVVVTSGAPDYTLGTSATDATQKFALCKKGCFTVLSGASGVTIHRLWYHAAQNARPNYRYSLSNGSDKELVVTKFGGCDGTQYGQQNPTTFSGTGAIRLCGLDSSATGYPLTPILQFQKGGRLIFDGNFYGTSCSEISAAANSENEIEITDGYKFSGASNWYGFVVPVSSKIFVSGEGSFQQYEDTKSAAPTVKTPTPHAVSGILTIGCKVVGKAFHIYSGVGTTALTRMDNEMEGLWLLSESAGATVSVTSFGSGDGYSSLGRGPVLVANSGRLLYTGAGETTDRAISTTNQWFGICNSKGKKLKAEMTLEQGGTGPLVFSGTLDCSGTGSATNILCNNTAQSATVSSVIADAQDGSKMFITKTGSGTWTLSGANTYTGETRIEAGTLAIEGDGSISSSSGIVVETGAATLSVGDDVAVTAADIVQKGSGALDIELGDAASFKCSTLSEGDAPAWLTVNHLPAIVRADGSVVPRQTKWKVASSGNWNDDGNWDNGIPDSTLKATIDKVGDYTVSVADAGSHTALALELKNGGNLDVASSLVVNGNGLAISDDSVMTVGSGANFTYSYDAADITVGQDGEFKQAGGKVNLISGSKATGNFRLDGGTASFADGVLNITNFNGFAGGGTVAFSGTEKVLSRESEGYNITFAGDAGKALEVSFTDSAYVYVANGLGHLVLGGTAGGSTLMTVSKPGNFAGSTANVGIGFYVGYGNGYANLTCDNATGVISAGNGGVTIGMGASDVSCTAPTGVVHLVGSKLSAGGVGFWWNKYWGGLSVGNGISVKKGQDGCAVGRIEISGSTGYLSVSGACGIGVGRGNGEVIQDDGNFYYSGSSTWSSLPARKQPMVLGYAGGIGAYVLSNGVAKVVNAGVFVGGCTKQDLNRYWELNEGGEYVQSGLKDASGRLVIHGGSFEATNNVSGIVLGADGCGVLEIGPLGSLVATSVSVSNQVSGTLEFKLGENGRAGYMSSADLEIAKGAKLVVDARNVRKLHSWIRLAETKNPPVGEFAASDVTYLTNAENRDAFAAATIAYEHNGQTGIWLKLPPSGLMLIVR